MGANSTSASLRKKLVRNTALTFLGVIAATTGLVSVQNYSSSRQHLEATEATLRASLETKGRLLADNHALALGGLVDANAFGDVESLIAKTVDDDDDVIYGLFLDSSARSWALTAPGDPDRKAWADALALHGSPEKALHREVSLYGQDIVEFATVVSFEGEPLGTVRYGLSTTRLLQHVAEARQQSFSEMVASSGQLLGLGLLSLGVGIWLTRRSAIRITEPVSVLTAAAERIAGGEKGVQTTISSGDEIEVLAVAFNTMVSKVEASQQQLEAFNRDLEAKVAARTRDLEKKTDDVVNMLENIQQGVFTLLPGQILHHEHSAHLTEILETTDIGGRTLAEVLLSRSNLTANDIDTIDAVLNTGFEQMLFLFECNAHMLPTSFSLTIGARTKLVEAEWIGIADADEALSSIMITLRDVTELRALKQQAEAQQQQLEVVGQLLAIPAEQFLAFAKDSVGFVRRNQALIRANHTTDPEVVAEMFRNTHTIKGNARLLGLTRLNTVAHEAETAYRVLREGGAWSPQELLDNEAALASAIQGYQDVYDEKLAARSGEGEAAGSAALLDALETLFASERETEALLAEARRRLSERDWRALSSTLSTAIQSLSPLAESLGKAPPVVTIAGDVLIPPALVGAVQNVFVHILRNALDHGIETPAVRRAAGKPDAGEITIHAHRDGDRLVIWVTDDGRGLAIERLRAVAGPGASDAEAAEVVFRSGASTATDVTDVSGRGVGMDAVRHFLQQLGGGAEIVLGEARAPGFRAFALVLSCSLQAPARASA